MTNLRKEIGMNTQRGAAAMIKELTLETAQQWQADSEKWSFCCDHLSISDEFDYTDTLVARMERKCEKLLKAASK